MIPFEWLQKNWVFARAARICVPSPGISGRAFRFRSPYAGHPGDRQRFVFGRRAVSVSRVGSGEDLEFSYLVPSTIVVAALDDPRRLTHSSACPQCRSARWPMPGRYAAADLGPRFTCATPRARADDARSTSWRTTREAVGSQWLARASSVSVGGRLAGQPCPTDRKLWWVIGWFRALIR